MRDTRGDVNQKGFERLHRASALVLASAILFFLFFQANKSGPLRGTNPFAEDPYDAIGSFAVQAALLVGILSYARALRVRSDASQSAKARLVLLAELVVMILIAILSSLALAITSRAVPTTRPPDDLTPADAIDDLWTLVRLPVSSARAVLPDAIVGRVDRLTSDSVFAGVRWIDPSRHPWRFACLAGLLAGAALTAAQLTEGLPPNLAIGLLVASIFISGELVATLAGFALLGRYLGVRPGVSQRK